MLIDVYIGLADDQTFSWGRGNYNGNIPKRISPPFPSVHRSANDLRPGSPFSMGNTCWQYACEDFGLALVQLDWGAYGAKISKTQILELLARFAPTAPEQLTACVHKLSENKEYAIILAEMYSEIED